MANTNAYCLLISIALGISLFFEYCFKKYLGYTIEAKKAHIIISIFILIVGVSISVFTLLPPIDSTLQGGANQWFLNFDINRLLQTVNRIWRSYIMVIIPSDSKRALIGPPAMIPVPGAAALRITLPAPNRPTIS